MNHGIIRQTRLAAAAIAAHLIAAVDTGGKAKPAAAATDKLLGVVDEVGADAAGQTIDVTELGLADVRAGAAFADGAPLTADAQGRAVAAVLVAGSTVSVIGYARAAAAAAGDIVPMLVAPSLIVG